MDAAESDRLRDEYFVSGALRDNERRRDKQQNSRDENDRRHHHREQNRGGDEKNDYGTIHRVCSGRIAELRIQNRSISILSSESQGLIDDAIRYPHSGFAQFAQHVARVVDLSEAMGRDHQTNGSNNR